MPSSAIIALQWLKYLKKTKSNYRGVSGGWARIDRRRAALLAHQVLGSQRDQKIYLTGKSFSEALILASTNPQYDKRLFIDLPVQYMKTTSSEHGENILCAKIVLNVKTKTKKQFVCTTCSPHVLGLLFSCIELVNQ